MVNLMSGWLTWITCHDGTCCCMPERGTVAMLSAIGMCACVMDLMSEECCSPCRCLRHHVISMRRFLTTMFQVANAVLLYAAVLENAYLIKIYVWYTMGFIVMGFAVAILDYLFRTMRKGIQGFVVFLLDVAYLFALYLCMPIVDDYRKQITK